jgi:hypothetical protein
MPDPDRHFSAEPRETRAGGGARTCHRERALRSASSTEARHTCCPPRRCRVFSLTQADNPSLQLQGRIDVTRTNALLMWRPSDTRGAMNGVCRSRHAVTLGEGSGQRGQSAESPQEVRRTSVSGQHLPTAPNDKPAGHSGVLPNRRRSTTEVEQIPKLPVANVCQRHEILRGDGYSTTRQSSRPAPLLPRVSLVLSKEARGVACRAADRTTVPWWSRPRANYRGRDVAWSRPHRDARDRVGGAQG